MAALIIDEDNEGYLVYVPDDDKTKRLFCCALHREPGEIPYGEDWPGLTREWIQKWRALTTPTNDEEPTSPKDEIRGSLGLTEKPRSDSEGGFQATCNGYQLYTFTGNDDDGEVWGLFEPVVLKATAGDGVVGVTARGP